MEEVVPSLTLVDLVFFLFIIFFFTILLLSIEGASIYEYDVRTGKGEGVTKKQRKGTKSAVFSALNRATL